MGKRITIELTKRIYDLAKNKMEYLGLKSMAAYVRQLVVKDNNGENGEKIEK